MCYFRLASLLDTYPEGPSHTLPNLLALDWLLIYHYGYFCCFIKYLVVFIHSGGERERICSREQSDLQTESSCRNSATRVPTKPFGEKVMDFSIEHQFYSSGHPPQMKHSDSALEEPLWTGYDINPHISYERSPPAILSERHDHTLIHSNSDDTIQHNLLAYQFIQERKSQGRLQYLVLWADNQGRKRTWEFADDLKFTLLGDHRFEDLRAEYMTHRRPLPAKSGAAAAALVALPSHSTLLSPSLTAVDLDDSTSGSDEYSHHCGEDDCTETCPDDCEDSCEDDNCSQKCTDDCNQDDCEDCRECVEEKCYEPCKPCLSNCPDETICVAPHGSSICYDTACFNTNIHTATSNCGSTPCYSPSTYINGVEPNMLNLSSPLTSPYFYPYQFGVPTHNTLDTHFHLMHDQERHSKRRKPNSPTQMAFGTRHDEHVHDTTPTHLGSAITMDDTNNVFCHWGTGCEAGFEDRTQLEHHVLQAHFKPQQQTDFACHWGNCGEAATDPDMLWSHVKDSHAQMNTDNTCFWENCNASFSNWSDLDSHLRTTHAPLGGILCEWESCGKTGVITDLATHLHTDHLGVSIADPTNDAGSDANIKLCQWCEDDGVPCGKEFSTPEELQKHTKEAHIAKMKKRTGYYCHWAGCQRRDKPFSQKGKVGARRVVR